MTIRDDFFNELYNIASKDHDVMLLTTDMGAASLDKFRADLPNQFINVGVAEQNAVSVAAGLALGGKKVFIYAMAAFITQRCYEQIKIDLCDMCLPVTIIGMGPGRDYASEGPTHHAIYDAVIMSVLPNMKVLDVFSRLEATNAAQYAYNSQKPLYIRLRRG